MNNIQKTAIAILFLVAGLILYFSWHNSPHLSQTSVENNSSEGQIPPSSIPTPKLADPISNAESRITKKPFGIYITPQTSPVQPEKFTGFHTGTDFETTPEEANIPVPFYAICDGKILTKRTATGYGGVLVQSCTIENQAVTVVYGHVSLTSIPKNIGDPLASGEQIGNLGHSPDETDGERKHLHLGIHKGTAINILGYVQNQSDLSGWLDWQKIN
ncbi:MAG TPA: M23 family metallopeptidase [Methylomirabilota bacterium]|nr:M23 family metallopeptidase [Methylomirabilota bacterium]